MADIDFSQLDELEEIEEVETPDSSKNKPKKSKKPKGGYTFKTFFLATLVPTVVASALFFGAGVLFGSASKSQQPQTRQVNEVNKVQTLKDMISDSKDAQIKALQTQLANVVKKQSTDQNDIQQNKQLLVAFGQINQDLIGRLNPLFEKLIAIKRYSKDEELDLVKKDLEQYIDTSANPNLIYDLLTGDSVSKDLNSDLVMVGSVTSSFIGSTSDENYIYLNIVPCMNDMKKSVNAIYLTTIQKNKVINLSYVGYIYDKDVKNFYNSYNDLLNKAASKAREEASADGQQN